MLAPFTFLYLSFFNLILFFNLKETSYPIKFYIKLLQKLKKNHFLRIPRSLVTLQAVFLENETNISGKLSWISKSSEKYLGKIINNNISSISRLIGKLLIKKTFLPLQYILIYMCKTASTHAVGSEIAS
jgi:hypothetical protein